MQAAYPGFPRSPDLGVDALDQKRDRLSGAESIFLPDKWLIDSGSDINMCYFYDLLSYIAPADIDKCTPLGSTPLPVLGKGNVKMCIGHYIDHNGLTHPIDLEIENVYWVPCLSMNVVATLEINTQNIFLFTVPRGNGLIMPGFANQQLGKFFDSAPEVVDATSPVLVFNLGKGRPIMRSHPVDSGLVWTDVTDAEK